jgi:hypothetical protein
VCPELRACTYVPAAYQPATARPGREALVFIPIDDRDRVESGSPLPRRFAVATP